MTEVQKRWEFVEGDTVKACSGRTLTRIRAIIDDPLFRFKAGDLGGYVEREENLPQNENGWVGGNAQAYGHSRIGGDSLVCDHARVGGHAEVGGNALLCGKARVGGYSRVDGNARVGGRARIGAHAWVYGNAQVGEDALIGGAVRIGGNSTITAGTIE